MKETSNRSTQEELDEQEVLSYWFPPGIHEAGAETYRVQWLRWFAGGSEVEQEIAERFGGMLEQARRGELDSWAETPRGRLALIIVLDQFSRGVYKDTSLAYAQDPAALRLAQEGIAAGMDRDMEVAERLFFTLPLGHTEGSDHLERLERVVRCAEEQVELAPPHLKPMYEFSLGQAKGHRDVIARFGRHPHRNAVLGRASTPEELEYLKNEVLVHTRRPQSKDKETIMIAVMGAAGNVGSKVADLLLHLNEEVRVFEHARSLDEFRERGTEVVTGDATNSEDLESLFEDAVAAFVLLPENMADPYFVATRSAISLAFANALREQPVDHVVALSAVGVDQENAAGPPAGLHEYEERLFEHKDVNLLVLRPAFYMDNLLTNLPLIQSQKINGSAIEGDLKLPMIATQDVAREAAERLARRDFTGHRVKTLLGPEDVSMREATRAMGSLLGLPELPYVEFSPEDMKGALLAAGMSEEAASLLVDMQLALNEGRQFDSVQRTAETTSPTRLEEYLKSALSR